MSTPVYAERLTVPLRWWAQGTMFVATLWLAFIVSMPGFWAWTVTAVILVLMSAAFVAYGSARVEIVDGRFRAGRAEIDHAYLGRADALDEEATRLTAGRDANARAYLLLRPYLHRAVRVEIADPADPTPYWLVNTRHPETLATALAELDRS